MSQILVKIFWQEAPNFWKLTAQVFRFLNIIRKDENQTFTIYLYSLSVDLGSLVIWLKWPFDVVARFIQEIGLKFHKNDLDRVSTRDWVQKKSMIIWFFVFFVCFTGWAMRASSSKAYFDVFDVWAFDQRTRNSTNGQKLQICLYLIQRLQFQIFLQNLFSRIWLFSRNWLFSRIWLFLKILIFYR